MSTGRSNQIGSERLQRRFFSARRRQLVGAAGLVAYVIISTTAAFVINGPSPHPSRELFPFFSWSLFSRTSNSRKEYHLDVFALNGQTMDPPVDMRSIDAFQQFSGRKSLGYKALQNLGDALRNGDKDSEAKRERFGAQFFGRHTVDYRISRHGYNPLQRWREGPSSDDVTVIGRFFHEGGS